MKKVFYFILGTLSLCIGAIGALLPIIPGTPFIVFSVVCYLKSSKKVAGLLMKNRHVREHVENHKTKSGISLNTKLISLALSLTSFAVSLLLAKSAWLKSVLILIYGTIALRLLFTKTRE